MKWKKILLVLIFILLKMAGRVSKASTGRNQSVLIEETIQEFNKSRPKSSGERYVVTLSLTSGVELKDKLCE